MVQSQEQKKKKVWGKMKEVHGSIMTFIWRAHD
jgi:hypothetical protein